MQAIFSETGFAFNATEYASLYGNEQLLKLQRKYTIRTVDRTTKIPQITKMFGLVKGPKYSIIEFARFCMNELVATTQANALAPIRRVINQLPRHDQLEDIIVSIINTTADLATFERSEKVPGERKCVKHTISVDELFSHIGLTVFDESQMYVSKEFRKVFRRIRSRYTIDLSATADIREDILDVIHQSWIGPILDAETLPGYNATTDAFIFEARLIDYHALNEHCQFSIRDDGMIDYASIVEALITDPNRNALIVDEIIKLMTAGLFTFVFSDRRTHVEHLYELLETRCKELALASSIELPEAEKKVLLYGGAREDTIEKAKTLSTVILTTYAYSSTGVSNTKMNALVLSTPRRSNMTQIINRVFRLGSDQSIKRIIIDVCDAKMPIKQQVRERIKAYHQRGSTILRSTLTAMGLPG